MNSESGDWPKDWCRAVFVPLPKKGNLKECSNHRTISLIAHASKILLKIIMSRIKNKYFAEISEEQAGFVEGKGTREQIVNMRNIIQKCRDHNIPVYFCFIDYAKAFDCVSHQKLWCTMETMGFPTHIVKMINNLYKNQESAVRTSFGNSHWFKIGRGVRQGCILSPYLYNIYAEDIMREVLGYKDWGVKIAGVKISNLRFADDTTLICSNKEELMEMLNLTKRVSLDRGLKLNAKKTKVMVLDNDFDGSDFTLDGEKIERVKDFVYLGSCIDTNGKSSTEIKRRLAMAKGTVLKMDKIWKSKGISTALKVRLLQASVFSIASYASESWALTKREENKLDAFKCGATDGC